MSANVSQSYNVLGQAPLDAKLIFKNKQAFIDHTVNNEFFAFNFYKGMLVYFQEEETFFIWELAYSQIYEQNNKVLENNFIYPLGTIYNGLDYSEKAFNLIEIPINKSNIGQWNEETLDEKTLTIIVDESTISNVFVPEQITEIWPQAEKISFIDGNINGIKFQGKQIKYNEEFSLLDWDQLTYEVWNPDAAYIQNAKMRVIMIGENIDYTQYENRILANSFTEAKIIHETVSAKNKNSIYFSSEGNSFDILVVDKFFVVKKISDYYAKKDASNVSQNATDWRIALELYSKNEIDNKNQEQDNRLNLVEEKFFPLSPQKIPFLHGSGYFFDSLFHVDTSYYVGLAKENPSELLDVNGNVKGTLIKDQYGTLRSQRVITVTGNITLSEMHNGAILHITNTCNITIPTGLGADFACDCYVKGAFIATFVNGGVTLNSPSGLLLKTNKMATLYSNASDTFNLLGELVTS